MSEEITEEEKDVRLMEIIQVLSELGENKIANELFKKVEKKITFAEREDWINEQICSMFPSDIDIKCLAFCCSPSNNCPYRAAVLRKLGWDMGDYIKLKADFGNKIAEVIGDGKSKSEKKSVLGVAIHQIAEGTLLKYAGMTEEERKHIRLFRRN